MSDTERRSTVIQFKLTAQEYAQACKQLMMPWLRPFFAVAIIALAALIFSVFNLITDGGGYIVPTVLFSLLLIFSVVFPFVLLYVRIKRIGIVGECNCNLHFTESEVKLIELNGGVERAFPNVQVKFLCKNKNFIYLQLPDTKQLLIIPNTYDADMATVPLAKETAMENAIVQQRQKPLYTVSVALAALSFLSIIVAFVIALLKSQSYALGMGGMARYIWVALCFLPLPVAVIVLAYFQRSNRKHCVTLVVVGTLAAIFLLEMGLWPMLLDKDIFSRTNVTLIEQRTGLTFPEELTVVCNGNDSFKEINALVAEKDRENFAQQLMSDERWTNELPEQLLKLSPLALKLVYNNYNNFLFYNETSQLYNDDFSAGSEVIFACYNSSNGALYIIYDYALPEEALDEKPAAVALLPE